MRRIGCILLVASALAAASLSAEEIQLKNGNKIEGKLTGITGDIFQIKTAYGDIKVPRSDVLTITFPENQPPKKADEKAESTVPPVDDSLEGTTYRNHTANFEATVPAGWTISPELRLSKDIVAALKSPDSTLFFLVTPEDFAGSLATYRVLVETQVQNKFKDYEKLAESEASLDGRTGTRVIFRARNADNNTMLKFMVYILPYEGRIVRLSFFTLEPLFNDAVPTFEKIAASYHTIKTGGTAGN